MSKVIIYADSVVIADRKEEVNESNVKEKVKEVKKPVVNKEKEKNKIEKEINKLMEVLESLNEKLNDPEVSYNWVEYKELHDKINETEEKIEILMINLENLDA